MEESKGTTIELMISEQDDERSVATKMSSGQDDDNTIINFIIIYNANSRTGN